MYSTNLELLDLLNRIGEEIKGCGNSMDAYYGEKRLGMSAPENSSETANLLNTFIISQVLEIARMERAY